MPRRVRRWWKADTRSLCHLDSEAAHGVCVVAGPGLRHVTEHAEIEPVAAGSAGFKQDVRKACSQLGEHLIKPEHVAMKELSLTLRRQHGGVSI